VLFDPYTVFVVLYMYKQTNKLFRIRKKFCRIFSTWKSIYL